MTTISKKRLELIKKTLSNVEISMKLVAHLLEDLEDAVEEGKLEIETPQKPVEKRNENTIITGEFDGENMVTGDHKKYPVPANYAAKSGLVFGDNMKIDSTLSDGRHNYKVTRQVPRQEMEGVLHMKDGKYVVKLPIGELMVLDASVKHHNLNIGDRAQVIVPRDVPNVTFASIKGPAQKVNIQETARSQINQQSQQKPKMDFKNNANQKKDYAKKEYPRDDKEKVPNTDRNRYNDKPHRDEKPKEEKKEAEYSFDDTPLLDEFDLR